MTLASIKMHEKLIKSNMLTTMKQPQSQPSVIKIQAKKTLKKKNIFGVQTIKQTFIAKNGEGTILPVLATPKLKKQSEAMSKGNEYASTYGQM